MEIKIDSKNMLKVLVKSGIDSTDAKAIIFDLIQYPDGDIPEEEEEEEEEKEEKVVVKKKNQLVYSGEVDEVEDKDKTSSKKDETIKSRKRINFSEFGGTQTSLSGI